MMSLSLTKAELIALRPCSIDARLTLFGRKRKLTARQALDAGASISDILWVLGQLGRKDLCVEFALRCSQRVVHLNSDPRVKAALDATQHWLDVRENPSAESASRSAAWSAESAARSARSAARSVAWSAAWSAESAARSAWSAAWSARSAAWSAESAARSARSAAWSAESAARSAEQDAQKLILLEILER